MEFQQNHFIKMKRGFIVGKNPVKAKENDQTAKKYFVEYCENCSIHGVRYFTERKRHWSERFWWIVAFSVSLWLCGSSIKDTWIKWHENLVTMRWNGLNVPISDIPFPTVTICPETKTDKEKFNISDALNDSELSPENSTRLDALTHICPLLSEIFLQYPNKNFENYETEDIYQALEDMAPTLSRTILMMRWQNKIEFSRSEYFVPVLSENGLCFTFNALNAREIYTEEMAPGLMIVKSNSNVSHWTLDDGYEDDPVKEDYPIRVTGSGKISALDLGLLLYERDYEYNCRGFDQGFLVTLTTPGETLKMSSNSLRVPSLENTLIKIFPKLTTTSDGLISYSPNRRQCFFAFERRLRFFKMYTQNNCDAECLSNFTKNECKCVKFSMPRDVHTKICGPAKIECYRNAERILLTNKKAKSFREKCNCLQECTKIEYYADIDRVKFDWATIKNVIKPDDLDGGPQLANLAIFFENQHVETITRMEMSTYTDFLAGCGGLLGLFLGVSALSIIECIYYSTLRLFWTFHQLKTNNAVKPFRQHIHAPGNRTNFRRNTQFDRSVGKF